MSNLPAGGGVETANPVLVEVLRGDTVECIHRGAAVVCDARGNVIAAWGDIARPIFPRSAIKPLQALPLVESGAADRFGCDPEELALACASHTGEPAHVEAVAAWLTRLGVGVDALECGAHMPLNRVAATALLRRDAAPSALHNNCSGKHAGMITTALAEDEPVAGYVGAEHPVQRRVRRVLEEMSETDLDAAPAAIDGCSIPTIAMPLAAMARAMARFGDPAGLAPARAAACARLAAAMMAHPVMVAGSGRVPSVAMTAAPGVLVKNGAEGVYCAVLPERGLGIALKIDDGARRAAEIAIAALLRHLDVFDGAGWRAVEAVLPAVIYNRNRLVVGAVRPAPGWPA